MRYVITTPEHRWTGEVAGIAFAHGQGITSEDPPARVLNYFRRKGYGVKTIAPTPDPSDVEIGRPVAAPLRPGKDASKADLVAYSVAVLELPEADATAKTRTQLLDLIDEHHKEGE